MIAQNLQFELMKSLARRGRTNEGVRATTTQQISRNTEINVEIVSSDQRH